MRNDTLDWHAIQVGDELPPMELDLTPTFVVAGALATRDFMPVHHDKAYANSQGAPEIFLNIMTDNGYCSRFLTDWAGPEAMVRKVAIRLGVPAFAHSKLRYTGSVVAKSEAGGEGLVEVQLRASNDLGDHISGTGVVSLPLERSRR
jgi:acyl dehydratase